MGGSSELKAQAQTRSAWSGGCVACSSQERALVGEFGAHRCRRGFLRRERGAAGVWQASLPASSGGIPAARFLGERAMRREREHGAGMPRQLAGRDACPTRAAGHLSTRRCDLECGDLSPLWRRRLVAVELPCGSSHAGAPPLARAVNDPFASARAPRSDGDKSP